MIKLCYTLCKKISLMSLKVILKCRIHQNIVQYFRKNVILCKMEMSKFSVHLLYSVYYFTFSNLCKNKFVVQPICMKEHLFKYQIGSIIKGTQRHNVECKIINTCLSFEHFVNNQSVNTKCKFLPLCKIRKLY